MKMIKIAVTKGRIEKDVCDLLKKAGFDTKDIETKDRELIVRTKDNIEIMFTKSNDVLTFIKSGICDLGVIGKDVLDESEFKDYNELLDLNVGKCYFALASYPDYKTKGFGDTKKKIATKYPNITTKYFGDKQENIEIIKLEGSVELAPICGMSDAIVDIVETGSTLKANGLEVIEKIKDISTRLIANKESMKEKSDEILKITSRLEGIK
jgi:ATP phosphoribosyltransferase